MKYLFELSRDHDTIPIDEITSCLKAEEIDYNILEKNNDILIIDTDHKGKIRNVAERLSHTFFINNFLFSSDVDLDEIKSKCEKNRIKTGGSIAIKYKNRSQNIDSRSVVRTLADIYTKNREVDLEKPDIEVRALITDLNVYTGIKLFEIERSQFENRKVQNRPFFSPISLHPKIARSLVNLSCVKKNGILLDPFCGTGGILLEAGLIGSKVVGSDIEEKMIQGSKETLDFYKIRRYDLFQSDVGDITNYVKKVDAIATDLPYGKSTTTQGEDMNDLYNRTFKVFANILKKKGRAVVGLSNKEWIEKAGEYLNLLEVHKIRAHRSLTRFFAVFEQP
jgi:tRNA (guanine10-N2)-dimethyltransferase